MTVLVIDDEPQIRRVIRNALRDIDDRVIEAATGEAGIDLAAAEQPGLIILDLGLPDRSGIDVCRDIRGFSAAPIIVLSARHSDSDKVTLLDAGADDYVTKPFSTTELQARVRAHLRRATKENAEPKQVAFGAIVVDLVRRSVTRAGELLHLTPTEWEVLRVLVTHPDQTLTHRQLGATIWNGAHGDVQQYLRVYVGQLRRKLEDDPIKPRFIKTEPSVGYRFDTGT
ncbi:MAG TPA: response regulator [Gemmatimonadaceae bacterium]|jgi:two-component system KDP operon response regulator KdpE